ncbi:MAG TPA: DUF6703 family protein [Motilibacteraceae bacterium]|nr:DUF6703 family protein [Motilibacteraceae bacterium]
MASNRPARGGNRSGGRAGNRPRPGGRPGRQPERRPQRPVPARELPAAAASTTPGSLRARVERASYPALVALARGPRWLLAVLLAGLLLAGLVVGGWLGAVLVLVVALSALWLSYLSWPALPASARVTRLLVLAVLLGAVVVAFTG